MTGTAYIRRVAGVLRRDPQEFFDRLRGQIEMRRERGLARPVLAGKDWMPGLHVLLGAPYPCGVCGGFDQAWAAMEKTLAGSGHEVGKGYDGGIDLARGAYAAVRHLRPAHVVETGVARGITSRIILEALRDNGNGGRLHSIDLPPLVEGWHTDAATAVPPEAAVEWDYRRGASRRVLPGLLRELGSVPLFVHDSLHTYANMTWEMRTAWPHIAPGGLLLCDDIEDNEAFSHFADGLSQVVAKEERRSGFIGAVRKD